MNVELSLIRSTLMRASADHGRRGATAQNDPADSPWRDDAGRGNVMAGQYAGILSAVLREVEDRCDPVDVDDIRSLVEMWLNNGIDPDDNGDVTSQASADDTPDREHALGEWRTTRRARPCLSPRDCAGIPAGALYLRVTVAPEEPGLNEDPHFDHASWCLDCAAADGQTPPEVGT